MARRTPSNSPSSCPNNTFAAMTRPGLVVDIGPDGEVMPRWMQVSIFTPVSRGNPRGAILQLGLKAN